MINCLLAGVGGQGTVLASKLIAQAAMDKGLMVVTSETIGMAQRGGCVVSHVRMGQDIHSPLIPQGSADVIIGFEPAEAVRYLTYLKKDGTVIVSKNAIKPVTDSLAKTNYNGNDMIRYLKEKVKNLIIIDGDAVTMECGSPKVLNTALLGAASQAGVLGFSIDDMEKVLKERLPKKFLEVNLCALKAGAKAFSKENKI
jgi:indolepyruvate ferredoxin oxidoreductase beta subunit